jgi:hypothetical protein
MLYRADDPELGGIKTKLATQLDAYLASTADPRSTGNGQRLDEVMRRYPVTGSNNPSAEQRR